MPLPPIWRRCLRPQSSCLHVNVWSVFFDNLTSFKHELNHVMLILFCNMREQYVCINIVTALEKKYWFINYILHKYQEEILSVVLLLYDLFTRLYLRCNQAYLFKLFIYTVYFYNFFLLIIYIQPTKLRLVNIFCVTGETYIF